LLIYKKTSPAIEKYKRKNAPQNLEDAEDSASIGVIRHEYKLDPVK
jgi:hypothetical protein